MADDGPAAPTSGYTSPMQLRVMDDGRVQVTFDVEDVPPPPAFRAAAAEGAGAADEGVSEAEAANLAEGHLLAADEIEALKEEAVAVIAEKLDQGHIVEPAELAMLKEVAATHRSSSPIRPRITFNFSATGMSSLSIALVEEDGGSSSSGDGDGGGGTADAKVADAVTREAIDAAVGPAGKSDPKPPAAGASKPKPGRPAGRVERGSKDSKDGGGKASSSARSSKESGEKEKAEKAEKAAAEKAQRAEAAKAKKKAEAEAKKKAEAEAEAKKAEAEKAKRAAATEAKKKKPAAEAAAGASKAAKKPPAASSGRGQGGRAAAAAGGGGGAGGGGAGDSKEGFHDHFPMAPAGLLLAGPGPGGDTTFLHPDELEALAGPADADDVANWEAVMAQGGHGSASGGFARRSEYLLPMEPPNLGERRLLQVERQRASRPAEPLMTPLFESGAGYGGQERHAHLHGRLVSRAELEAAGPRSRSVHELAQARRMRAEAQRRDRHTAQLAQQSYEEEHVLHARRQAAAEREREMLQLEMQLAEAVNSKRSTLQQHSDSQMDPSAYELEALQEEAISSVVQHLTPFSLNRNLPWQIYATRPKRFARVPGGSGVTESASAVDAALMGLAAPPGALMGLAAPPAHASMGMGGGPDGGGGMGPVGGPDGGGPSMYGLSDPFDGGESAVPPQDRHRAVLRSVYDKPTKPPRRGYPGAGGGVAGGVSPRGGFLPPIDAWPSPRRSQQRNDGRALSPRVMGAIGSYY